MADRMLLLATLWAVLFSAGRSAEIETDPTVKGLLETKKRLESSIALTTCCNQDELYSVGFDHCNKRWEINMNRTEAPFPTIYSSKDNMLSRGVHQSPTTGSLRPCPSGHVAKSSTEFRIYDDGSLKTVDGFKVSDFCLNRIHSSAETNDEGESSAVFAVRFCIVDECTDGAAGRCVHKCCPIGMALNTEAKICQLDLEPFSVPFHHRNGSRTEVDPSVRIRDGVPLDCAEGFYKVDDKFYILPDGTLHIPTAIKGISDKFNDSKYCVDHFIDENNTINLGALECFPTQEPREQDISFHIYPYFLLASSFFLVATFVVYALLPQLRNTYGVSIMCHTASMSVMYIGLAIIQLYSSMTDIPCITMAVIVHFAFLATFTWLNVQSFDIWWAFKNMAGTYSDHRRMRSDHKLEKKFLFYSLYAWSVPLLFVGFGQLTDNVDELFHNRKIIRPGFGVNSCWFHTRESYITYLYGPLAVLILLNTLFFILTTTILCRSSFDTRSRRDSANFHYTKQKFRAILILFVLMGLSWMTEIISFAVGGSSPLWIPTDILNILMGVFIFVIFVCKPNVWKLLVKKYPCLRKLDRLCPSCMRYNVEAAEQGSGQDDSQSDLQQTAI